MATGKLMSSESTMPSKVGTAIKTYGIAKNPKVFLAKKVIGGTANLASKISNRIQARRNARNMTPPPANKPTPIKSKANQVKHSSQPPKPTPQFEGKMQRQQHVQTTMNPLVKKLQIQK